MSKELWIEAYENLVDRLMYENEDMTEDEARKIIDDNPKLMDEAYGDHVGSLIDLARMRKKYEEV